AAISGERPQWQWTFQIGGAGARPLVDGASEPAPGDGETVDFSGAWYTNFAEVALQQDGATVSGHYTRYGQVENLRLTGAVTTNRLEGYFGEDPADRFFFVLGLDGNTLTGSWFSHSDDAHDWCGTRVGAGALPAGCGFSGNWLLSGGPGIDGQPDGPFMAQLEQIGSDVSGTVVAADPSATQPGAALVHGTIIANLGTVGAAPFYTASGLFTINGNSYSLRWTLLDFNSIQFQGCWATDTGVYPWCGWREDSVATIQCPTAPSCP
ncbi:MAG: hypothetical protein KDE19_18970, partial [Caldilineaceae bacterium]|nr:hypothetical protein [Caldilineaceae bacterium]